MIEKFKSKVVKNFGLINILLLVFVSTSCAAQDSLVNLDNINNENIKFDARPRPGGQGVIPVSVIGPEDAMWLSFSYNADTLNYLVQIMSSDTTKDWAMNVILYSVFDDNILDLYDHKNQISLWRQEQKQKDIEMWKAKIEEMAR